MRVTLPTNVMIMMSERVDKRWIASGVQRSVWFRTGSSDWIDIEWNRMLELSAMFTSSVGMVSSMSLFQLARVPNADDHFEISFSNVHSKCSSNCFFSERHSNYHPKFRFRNGILSRTTMYCVYTALLFRICILHRMSYIPNVIFGCPYRCSKCYIFECYLDALQMHNIPSAIFQYFYARNPVQPGNAIISNV